MVANATGSAEDRAAKARHLVAHQIAGALFERNRATVAHQLCAALPDADTATRTRAIAAFAHHLAGSIERHMLATYEPGVDCCLAVTDAVLQGWITDAVTDAVAAARCP